MIQLLKIRKDIEKTEIYLSFSKYKIFIYVIVNYAVSMDENEYRKHSSLSLTLKIFMYVTVNEAALKKDENEYCYHDTHLPLVRYGIETDKCYFICFLMKHFLLAISDIEIRKVESLLWVVDRNCPSSS